MLEARITRAIEVSKILLENYYHNDRGIFGKKETPEIIPPDNVKKGSLEHRLFLTFTISIDYLRESYKLWEAAWKAYNNPHYRYLFVPEKLMREDKVKVANDLKSAGMGRYFNRDASIIQKIAFGLVKFFKCDPINIIKDGEFNGSKILCLLRNKKYKSYFPFLSGEKIAPHWIRALKGSCDLKIDLVNVPIAVDVHVARATFSTGSLIGEYNGSINKIRKKIEYVWFEVAKILGEEKSENIYALFFQKPLWILSKFGCGKRRSFDNYSCPKFLECSVKEFCINGQIKVTQNDNGVQINTHL